MGGGELGARRRPAHAGGVATLAGAGLDRGGLSAEAVPRRGAVCGLWLPAEGLRGCGARAAWAAAAARARVAQG